MRRNNVNDVQEVFLPNNEPAVLSGTINYETRVKEDRCASRVKIVPRFS
jgi:hypothetical protein